MHKSHRLIIFLIIIVLGAGIWQSAVVAQDDDDSVQARIEATTFRPVEDILEGDLVVTDFASDGTATLPITTTISVACTIVYGSTPEFGRLTLDQDMAGGTHADHSPLLSNLESNTEYYFRVQGVDDLGVIYLSDLMTFTTPDFAALETEITNLASPALGAEIIGYSSAFGNAGLDERWGAGSAFDDNPRSEWATAGDGDNAWIEVELASRARITGVEFWSRAMTNGSSITLAFTVTTDSGEVYGPFTVPDTTMPYLFDVEIEASSLRFDLMETTGGNTGVVNIAVYGEFVE